MNERDGWRRLHPLSPVVRAGRATIAIFIVLVPTLLNGGRNLSSDYFQLGAVAVLAGLGHWWMMEDPVAGAAALRGFWSTLD